MMKSSVVLGALLIASTMNSNAEACVDGRTAKINCGIVNKVLTHYGCEQEYYVQCLDLSDIPFMEGVTTGGFRRTPQIDMTTLFRDGKAVQTTKIMDRATGKWSVTKEDILVLGKKVMTSIEPSALALKPGPYLPNTRPACMDAPTTIFTAYVVANGSPIAEEIPFYKIENCLPFMIDSPGVYDMKNVAESLDKLSNYAR